MTPERHAGVSLQRTLYLTTGCLSTNRLGLTRSSLAGCEQKSNRFWRGIRATNRPTSVAQANATVKGSVMTSQTALSPARGAKQLPQWIDARHTMPGTGLRLAMGLLERWQRRRWRRPTAPQPLRAGRSHFARHRAHPVRAPLRGQPAALAVVASAFAKRCKMAVLERFDTSIFAATWFEPSRPPIRQSEQYNRPPPARCWKLVSSGQCRFCRISVVSPVRALCVLPRSG